MCGHKLYLWPEKCKFEQTRIEYLGVIISHNKVEMDLVKIAGVADWLTPSNKKEVQSFVGFIIFYRCFIPGLSHHVHTLFDLTMKDIRFIWLAPGRLLHEAQGTHHFGPCPRPPKRRLTI
jgi:hypothetical protein